MASIISAGTTSGTALNMAGDTSGQLQLATNGSTTAVTIDASQNVGIGTASPSRTLSVYSTSSIPVQIESNQTDAKISIITSSGSGGQGFIQASSGSLLLGSSNTERMRIDSSGNVGIGSTSPGQKLHVDGGTGMSAAALIARFFGTSSQSMLIRGNGNVENSLGGYGTISDIKLKENVVDATSKLDEITKLKVRNYNLIGSDIKQIGFVAQEIEQVFPNIVSESSDLDENGNDLGTVTKTVKTSVLIPILVKAIQEQQAIINELKSRIEALESK